MSGSIDLATPLAAALSFGSSRQRHLRASGWKLARLAGPAIVKLSGIADKRGGKKVPDCFRLFSLSFGGAARSLRV